MAHRARALPRTAQRTSRQITPEQVAEVIHLVYFHHVSKALAARQLRVPLAPLRKRLRGWAQDAAARADEGHPALVRDATHTILDTIVALLGPDHSEQGAISEQGENWIAPEFRVVDADRSAGLDVNALFGR